MCSVTLSVRLSVMRFQSQSASGQRRPPQTWAQHPALLQLRTEGRGRPSLGAQPQDPNSTASSWGNATAQRRSSIVWSSDGGMGLLRPSHTAWRWASERAPSLPLALLCPLRQAEPGLKETQSRAPAATRTGLAERDGWFHSVFYENSGTLKNSLKTLKAQQVTDVLGWLGSRHTCLARKQKGCGRTAWRTGKPEPRAAGLSFLPLLSSVGAMGDSELKIIHQNHAMKKD